MSHASMGGHYCCSSNSSCPANQYLANTCQGARNLLKINTVLVSPLEDNKRSNYVQDYKRKAHFVLTSDGILILVFRCELY